MMNFQEKRLVQEISNIENDTGFKLRVLAQNYPETPGMIYNLFLLATQFCFVDQSIIHFRFGAHCSND